jgi:hypothetical protein
MSSTSAVKRSCGVDPKGDRAYLGIDRQGLAAGDGGVVALAAARLKSARVTEKATGWSATMAALSAIDGAGKAQVTMMAETIRFMA